MPREPSALSALSAFRVPAIGLRVCPLCASIVRHVHVQSPTPPPMVYTNSKYITNITPVGELLPLPYCLGREFLARDTRGYAFVEGICIYVHIVGIDAFSEPAAAAMQGRD